MSRYHNVSYELNKAHTRYTSALCGLGTDTCGNAMYPEHDFDIVFDVFFGQEDLEDINLFRRLMGQLLEQPKQSLPDFMDAYHKIKKLVERLILKHRKPQSLVPPAKPCRWGLFHPVVELGKVTTTSNAIFPEHPLLQLFDESEMIRNVQELLDMSTRKIDFEPTFCVLCNERIGSLVALVRHLAERNHKAAEDEIKTEKHQAMFSNWN